MRHACIAIVLVLGCAAPEPPQERSAAADAMPWLAGPMFFLESRALELTGDGVLDTLFLEARGAHADSIRFVLGALTLGDTAILARWDSRYQLSTVPEDSQRSPAELLQLLRAQLTRILHSVDAEPFDGARWIGAWVTEDGEPDCTARTQSCLAVSIRSSLSRSANASAVLFDTVRAAQALEELRAPGRIEVEFRYGTESSERVVWSPILQRFLTVSSCC